MNRRPSAAVCHVTFPVTTVIPGCSETQLPVQLSGEEDDVWHGGTLA